MTIDAIALGELLVDFTPTGNSPQGNPTYEAHPGGAPCNVLAMLSQRGKSTAFIGTVGEDLHGRMLTRAFQCKNVVDTTGAGDTFMGCCLAFIMEHGLDNLSAEDFESMLLFANAAASLVISRKGALRCMPNKEDVYDRQNRR